MKVHQTQQVANVIGVANENVREDISLHCSPALWLEALRECGDEIWERAVILQFVGKDVGRKHLF